MPSSACGFCKADGSCPTGTTNVGGVCVKNSYGRGAGEAMKCGSGQTYDAGLCYQACPSGATGVGPLCYKNCPPDQPYRVGVWCYHTADMALSAGAQIFLGTIVGLVLLFIGGLFIDILFVGVVGAEEVLFLELLDPLIVVGENVNVLDLSKSRGSPYAFESAVC